MIPSRDCRGVNDAPVPGAMAPKGCANARLVASSKRRGLTVGAKRLTGNLLPGRDAGRQRTPRRESAGSADERASCQCHAPARKSRRATVRRP